MLSQLSAKRFQRVSLNSRQISSPRCTPSPESKMSNLHATTVGIDSLSTMVYLKQRRIPAVSLLIPNSQPERALYTGHQRCQEVNLTMETSRTVWIRLIPGRGHLSLIRTQVSSDLRVSSPMESIRDSLVTAGSLPQPLPLLSGQRESKRFSPIQSTPTTVSSRSNSTLLESQKRSTLTISFHS